MSKKQFKKNRKIYEYTEEIRTRTSTVMSLTSNKAKLPRDFRRTATIYTKRFREIRKLERHEEQQTVEETFRTDQLNLESKIYKDGISTQTKETELLEISEIEPHEPANFAPTPEERIFETDQEAETRQCQSLEDINRLAEELYIATPELHDQEEDFEDAQEAAMGNETEAEKELREQLEEMKKQIDNGEGTSKGKQKAKKPDDSDDSKSSDSSDNEESSDEEDTEQRMTTKNKKERIPDVEEYYGQQRKLATWLIQLQIKF